MNFKELFSPDNLKSLENNPKGKNGSSESPVPWQDITVSGNAPKKKLIMLLKEREDHISDLEKLIKKRTKEMTDVVATNTKFISIIAHDLRSPFSTIFLVLEILKKSINDNNINESEKYINIASRSAINTLTLLDNLLAWTISQSEEKSFNPVRINLHELLSEEIENFTTSAKQKQILLTDSIDPDLCVSADYQMVKTVLRNLICNAIKYTNMGGKIDISASECDQFVEIVVKDNGIGISEEARTKLFKINAFYSTEGTNNEEGTGLGLLLCKEFVEMHGGIIRIESELGKGSELIFTLPHYL